MLKLEEGSMMTDESKETFAVLLMQQMLEDFSSKYNVSFEKAMNGFVTSQTYEFLFDLTTVLWCVGQNYLLELYETELDTRNSKIEAL